MPGEYVFGRGSNVLDYWLLHAEGFVVRRNGERVGDVREVVLDPGRGLASALVVRSRLLHRRRVVPVRAVDAVDPRARVLELEPKPVVLRERPSRRETLQRWSDELDRRADVAGAWLRPRLRAAALAAIAYARHLIVSAERARAARSRRGAGRP